MQGLWSTRSCTTTGCTQETSELARWPNSKPTSQVASLLDRHVHAECHAVLKVLAIEAAENT